MLLLLVLLHGCTHAWLLLPTWHAAMGKYTPPLLGCFFLAACTCFSSAAAAAAAAAVVMLCVLLSHSKSAQGQQHASCSEKRQGDCTGGNTAALQAHSINKPDINLQKGMALHTEDACFV
jgi:hypothetical protein